MSGNPRGIFLGLVVCVAGLFPATAYAQSAIAGVVRDSSGGVLPGVNVEASSPMLIEKTRTVVTDGTGQYRIVDLRPGVYSVTFTLSGFTTVKRDGLELPSAFTLPLNVEMRVGELAETVTVSGESPIVDVQSTSRSQVLEAQALETLPTGRSMQAIGQLVVGISLSAPDVGGSKSMQQTFMTVHGLNAAQNTFQVDGMVVNGAQNDGIAQMYYPQTMSDEMAYQTTGVGSEVSTGGLTLNMVPRDGGNTYKGIVFGSFTPGGWVNDSVPDSLRAQNFTAAGKTTRAYDVELGLGGPLKRDKVWFFGAVRGFSVDSLIAGTYVCAGCYGKAVAPTSGPLGKDEQYILPVLGRVTWQVSPRNKFSAFYDHVWKSRNGQMNPGFDPETAAQDYVYQYGYATAAKWTSTLSDRLLAEGGVSSNATQWTNDPVDHSVVKVRGTPEWYATPVKNDVNLGTTWNSAPSALNNPRRYYFQGAVSYITGAHALRTGVLSDFGSVRITSDTNADLTQRYRSGVADTVLVQNTPRDFTDTFKTFGIYVQDTWTLKRLTINPGLRWEAFSSANPEQFSPAGRFVGARHFDKVPNIPKWKDWAPRFGAAYDLFGNAKTALKFTLNRYNVTRTNGIATQYNPLGGANASASLQWTDLNRDDVAQGELGCTYLQPACEINLAALPANFGVRTISRLDPGTERPYSIERTITIQHELLPRMSVSGSWFHSDFEDLTLSYNTLRSRNDYTPVNVVSPLDGSVITIYNLTDPAKLQQVDNLDTTATDARRQWYNSFEFNVNARLPGGMRLFGGTATERTVLVACDVPDDPNADRFCDQSQSDIPWRTQIKLAGTLPLPWGLQFSGSLQSIPGAFTSGGGSINWSLSRTTRYAADCPGPCTPNALVIPNLTVASLTVPLTSPNTQLTERANQLDLNVMKSFVWSGSRIQARLDVFNSLNEKSILTVRSANYGTPTFRQPATILDGRTFRAGVQVYF